MHYQALDLIQHSQISVLRLRLTFTASERVTLPPFLGSTLRGAFGGTFKNLACLHPENECEERCADPACPYGAVFEPRRQTAKGGIDELPPAYVIRSLPSITGHTLNTGDAIRFEVLLFGPAIQSVFMIREAFLAAGLIGFGARRVPFLMTRSEVYTKNDEWRFLPFTQSDASALAEDTLPLSEIVARRLSVLEGFDGIRLGFLTPLRIRVAKKVREDLPFQVMVRAAANRIDELARAYGNPARCLNLVEELDGGQGRVEHDGLVVNDWGRYSNHQETKMNLGGLTGDIVYRGSAIRDALPLLIAGEALHIGSSTSFGLGLYELSPA